ncbi:c-type cytochrome biogenesis protein CcmI [Mannheimia haemolytica]|uniref:c-type cytochrome biogenesis protein CcmI n=1 Tax=Mannheimia haemolytica TaxID=75985 RepID=UPI000DA29887|nr:c-type cytochrome biogenesis protein CcmI [Mannheimia haemolytica]MCB4225958.1 c-type cytochrome biogenesis protein CcmI [Mannheimia haemolytica]MEE3730205.1 c-type cytochrome biogenesis protein CcmI [Mannheimia haemolytica]SQE30405.1 Cytochrome c-type biogenesis protein CcmH precursor [Mannheimia haemolytica]
MNFWLAIIFVTLIVCGVAFYPLLKKNKQIDNTKRDSLNKAFYFDRLKEVENEANEGVIDDPEQTKLELQKNLLDDIPHSTQSTTSEKLTLGKSWFVALILFVGGISFAIYSNVGSWFSNSMLDTTHQKLDSFYERLKTEETNPLSQEEMNQFAMALRVDLQSNPNDDKKWYMLGQIGMALDDGQLAHDAFSKAAQLKPDNLDYKLSHAQLLLFSEAQEDKKQGETLLKEIIRQDHTNFNALSLLAFHSFEKEDFKMAAMTWGMMLKLLPDEDPRKVTVERSFNMALSNLSEAEKQELQKGEKK